MTRTILAVLAFVWVSTTSQAQNLPAEDLARRAIERRAVEAVIWGMPAVNFGADVPGDDRQRQGQAQSGRLLVAPAGLEEPDAHAESRHDLSHAVLQHEGRRPDGAGDPARRRRLDHRQRSMDAWQTALEDVGPAGVDKGKGGKYLILPPGYNGTPPDGYIALPSVTYQGYALLRSNLEERQRRRHRQGRRLRQAHQVLSALAGGESRRRRSSSMRSTSSSTRRSRTTCASSSRSTASCRREPWFDARQGDDRPAQVDRHRERASRSIPMPKTQDDPERRPRAKRTRGWMTGTRRLFTPPITTAPTGRCRHCPT